MKTCIAFLRGINLGKRRVPMSRLKSLFEELGYEKVATFITSGNVIFSTPSTDPARLEARIAPHLKSALGYEVAAFVRPAAEVVRVGAAKMFSEDGADGVTIHVGFMQTELPANVARQLAAITTANDEFCVAGREYYWLCRIRTNESQVWKLPALKALKLPAATMRNLTSIRKLIAQHLTGK